MGLSVATIVSASLGADPARPDEDWFALHPAEPTVADLAVTGIPGCDVVIEVTDADKNRLALVNSEGDGKAERFPNLFVQERVFVRIAAAKKGAGGAYQLSVAFTEARADVEREPNDRAVDATPLALGRPLSGLVGHAADEDWYRLELPGEPSAPPAPTPPAQTPTPEASAAPEDGGPTGEATAADQGPRLGLRLELKPVPGVRLELSLLSAAEAPLFQARAKEGEGLTARNVGVRATDQVVYLVVKSAWSGTGKEARRGYNAEAPYEVLASVEDGSADTEYEPNDERAKATELTPGGFRDGFLSPKTDVDHYHVRTDEPVLLKVSLSGVERVDLVLSLIGPSADGGVEDQVLLRANDGAVKEPEQLNNVACAPECWLKVEGALRRVEGKLVRDYENAETPYRLSVTATRDDGSEEREPNNQVSGASALSLGRSMRGTVYPKRDVDYFRLDLESRPVKTALRATLTGILKVDVGLYLHRVEPDGSLSLIQTADRAKGEAPEVIRHTVEPGLYVFEVRDAKNREANFQDSYQLSVEVDE